MPIENSPEQLTYLDKLLLDLGHSDAETRRQAAFKLGFVAKSSLKVVEALVTASTHDSHAQVREAARSTLLSAVHQEILKRDFSSQAQSEIRADTTNILPALADHPGCLKVYIFLLATVFLVAGGWLWRSLTILASLPASLSIGRMFLKVSEYSRVSYSDISLQSVGQLSLGVMSGALLGVMAGSALLIVGIWHLKRWARMVLIGLHAMVILLGSLAFYATALLLFTPDAQGRLAAFTSASAVSLAAILLSIIFIWWLLRHPIWNNVGP